MVLSSKPIRQMIFSESKLHVRRFIVVLSLTVLKLFMIERRAFTRIGKKTLVSYDVLNEDFAVLDEGMARTTDISMTGLHMEIPRRLRVDDRLRLSLNIEEQMVTLLGTVVWVEFAEPFFQVGCQIDSVPRNYVTVLERLDDCH